MASSKEDATQEAYLLSSEVGFTGLQFGEFLGDRNNPFARLICQECGQEVCVKGTMTFEAHTSVLEFEDPDHEHEIFFQKRIVTNF